MPARTIDLTGKRFGRLVVISKADRVNGMIRWLCKCDCGNETVVYGNNLRRGTTRSCGCFRHEFLMATCKAHITHGQEPMRLYRVWGDMRSRCRNPNHRAYKYYGGRGITICAEWDDYTAFRDWAFAHGYREGLTIDRINNDGNYEPGNCRWITMAEQNKNKRKKGEAQ